MRSLITGSLLLTLALVVMAPRTLLAQPADGDLIVAANRQFQLGTSELLVWHRSTQSWSTLFRHATPNDTFYGARMASDNRTVVIGLNTMNKWPSHLTNVDVSTGIGTTVALNPTGWITSFERDADGWIISGVGQTITNHVWYSPDASGSPPVFSTLVSFPMATRSNAFLDVTIDRDPMHSVAGPYILAIQDTRLNTIVPRILRADRTGAVTTVVATSVSQSNSPLNTLNAIEVDPVSGQYLTCDFRGYVCLLPAGGGSPTVLASVGPLGQELDDARFTQNGLAWVALSGNPHLIRLDLQRSAVTSIMPISPLSTSDYIKGLEIYGSRKLVCNGTGNPGTSVQISLSSRRIGDANQRYALACSFNRRPATLPCLRFGNGEYLFLDRTDALFLTTVFNVVPTIFANFQGATDNRGMAMAQVNIPAKFPGGTGITVFVAGVIYSAGQGVHTVTNTHWFV